jgi:uncharacterized protein YciI
MENQTFFVVILRYLVPIEIIIEQRPEHVKFLDKYYAKGIFQASGPQIPRYGGVILARAKSRDELRMILEEDPFYIHKSAEYQITEFIINKSSEPFSDFLESTL